jgi:GNAT superfamily N-acetyltransferase
VIVAASYDSLVVRWLLSGLANHYVSVYGAHDLADDDPADYAPPSGGCLVGYENGTPVAVGCWRRHDADSCELRRFYVTPSSQGRGWSRRMLLAAVTAAAGSGYSRAMCATAAGSVLMTTPGLDVCPIAPYGEHADMAGAACYEVRFLTVIGHQRSLERPMQSHGGNCSSDINVA